MRLILFRHGPSGQGHREPRAGDTSRPLSERGVERTLAAAAGLAKFEPNIQLIFTSPVARASQTARILNELVPSSRLQVLEALHPDAPVASTLDALRDNGAPHVVLVGHDPHLAKLAGTLMFGAPVPLKIKKAGACAVDFTGHLEPGSGHLAWFLPPRALRRLAGKKQRV